MGMSWGTHPWQPVNPTPPGDHVRSRRSAVTLVVLVIACGGSTRKEAPSGRLGEFTLATSHSLPTLVEARPATADPVIIDKFGAITVASNGVTALFSETTGETSVLLVGVDGGIQAKIRKPGQGPGEFVWPSAIFFADTTLYVFSNARSVAIRYDEHGHFLDETPLNVLSRGVAGVSGGLADAMAYDQRGFAKLMLAPIGPQPPRSFISSANAFVEGAAADRENPGSLAPPPFVRSGRFGIVGNGWTYEIAVFDTSGAQIGVFGRRLPTQLLGPRALALRRASLEKGLSAPGQGPDNSQLVQRLDTIHRQHAPHFGRGGLGFDGKGRLWVVGTLGDSTFADVFADTTFLGRHVLPCAKSSGGASVSGSFLALRCLRDDDENYSVRLYQIVERR